MLSLETLASPLHAENEARRAPKRKLALVTAVAATALLHRCAIDRQQLRVDHLLGV